MNAKHKDRKTSALAVAGGAVLLTCLAGCGNDDDTTFIPGSGSGSGTFVPNSIAVADVNGDGTADLLVATTVDQGAGNNPGVAAVYLGIPASPGTYQPGVTYPSTGTDPSGIVVLDLSGAGTGQDLVVSNFGSGNASVFMHDPANPGKYLAATTVNTGGQPNQVVSADMNGDGKPDLIFADLSTSGNAIIALQDPAHPGQFLAPINLPTGNLTPSVAVGDLNGDGLPDVVAANYDVNGNHGQVTIFLQNTTTPAGTSYTAVSFPAGAQPQAVRIADVNHDGLPDLVVANRGPGSDATGMPGVSVLLQDPAHPGSFLAPVTYSTPWGAIDVAVGDLNGDGQPDLVVASLGPAPTGAVSVLLQNASTAAGSSLSFGTATSYAGFGQPLSVAIADLNGDGHPDIAVADGFSATVMLQSATMPGAFANFVPVN